LEWRELGWLGRVALAGILLSVVLTLILGFWIPSSAKWHLLSAQSDTFEAIATDLAERGLVSLDLADPAALAALDDEVRFRLIGGDTVRVKLWGTDGTIRYSDAPELIGQSFTLTEPAVEAMRGETSFTVSDLDDPAHALDKGHEELIEYYMPVVNAGGRVVGVFEVEQRASTLNTHLGHIRRNVWLSISIGLGVLAVFLGSLVLAGARASNKRRRQAEAMLGQMARAREVERKRIVGALHGEIGQPLYRLLYGLEGSVTKLDQPEALEGELIRLVGVVRDLDTTLRAELSLLHHGAVEVVGLEPALAELVETTRAETGLEIDLEVDLDGGLAPELGAALFWAAEEGVTNVRKHASASKLQLQVSIVDNAATLLVRDDGVGVHGPEGLGLVTVGERLDSIGGGLILDANKGGGTVMRAWVPTDIGDTPRE